jgi:hypothetical protein
MFRRVRLRHEAARFFQILSVCSATSTVFENVRDPPVQGRAARNRLGLVARRRIRSTWQNSSAPGRCLAAVGLVERAWRHRARVSRMGNNGLLESRVVARDAGSSAAARRTASRALPKRIRANVARIVRELAKNHQRGGC